DLAVAVRPDERGEPVFGLVGIGDGLLKVRNLERSNDGAKRFFTHEARRVVLYLKYAGERPAPLLVDLFELRRIVQLLSTIGLGLVGNPVKLFDLCTADPGAKGHVGLRITNLESIHTGDE